MNGRRLSETRTRRRNCRLLSGKVGDHDDSDEEWIPPVRMATASGGDDNEEAVLPKSERIETILEVSRQVKEQERLDRVIEESHQEAEALFQLTEEEQATLTDEEILERLEEVLKREASEVVVLEKLCLGLFTRNSAVCGDVGKLLLK